MPSLIPGFEYDVFISYRHNDNRSGWVSAFIENLKEELSSTIKDPISIYLDTNPHDGLLETHTIDKSLQSKLKCLIFIPIISQTYCDPKSFAWKNEFLFFNTISKEDQFGREVLLSNGNVASRILPIKIHDVDRDDKRLLENELGGVLRSIEFIYQSPGVNRPLRDNEDHPQDNLNKTYYLDQINKVANAIKEIISGLKDREEPGRPALRLSSESGLYRERAGKPSGAKTIKIETAFPPWKRTAIVTLVVLILSTASYWIYTLAYRKTGADEGQNKSIAVLPFENASGDKDQEYFSDGMMQEIINQLVKIRQLSVISLHSSMVYKGSKKPVKHIANKLGVANILEGRVQRSGDRVRIAVQLIDARTEKNLWSEIFVRDVSDIFSIQADISKNIARELKAVLSIHDVENLSLVPTTIKEAHDFYLKSLYYERKDDWIKGIDMCNKAIALDPKFTLAYVLRSNWNGTHFFNKWPTWEGRDQRAKDDMMKAIELNPDLPEVKICQAFTVYYTERKYEDALRILSGLQKDRPNDIQVYYWLGIIQRRQGLWRDALRNLEFAMSADPNNTDFLTKTAFLHFVLHHYSNAIEYANKALSIDPEVGTAGLVIYNSLLAWKGDPTEANNAITYHSGSAGLESISDSMRLEWARHYYNRQFGELLVLIDKSKGEISEDQNYYEPTSLRYARIYYLSGNGELSKKYAVTAIAFLKERLKQTKEDYRIYSALGYAYGYAGNFTEAVAYGKKANEIMPTTLDAFSDGLASEQSLVEIYILAGKYELAFDRIEHLLSIPGNISTELLKIDPVYDKLRSLPRYDKIIHTEYKLNY
jgi:TolB-like protein/Flp pilus assembly protein TadD